MSYILVPPGRPQIDKDPQASLVYGVDVADVLADGDSLTGSPNAVADGTSGLVVGAVARTGTVVLARVSGGAAGQVGSVTFTWSTTNGDTDQRTLYLRIVER